VLIDITKDAQQSSCDYDWDAAAPEALPRTHPHPAEATMQEAIELIRAARRPLVLAGHGLMLANATDEFRAFVDKTGIPAAITLLGIGALPASHPLNLGMMGMHGEAWVNTAIQEADLLIALGMRFDDRVTGNLKTYAQHARKIHVDIDPAEIGKNVPVDIGVVADVREAITAWLPHLGALDLGDWTGRIDALKGDSAVRDIQKLPDDGHLYAAHVISDLWRATHGRAVVVTDVGQHQMWEAQYYHHELPRTLVTSGGLGTMGFALPAPSTVTTSFASVTRPRPT
jgi:acetolactate synthase-1/2/3 large subunit